MRSAFNTQSVFDDAPSVPPDNWYARAQDWCDRYKIAGRIERYGPIALAVGSGIVAAMLFHSSKAMNRAVVAVLPTALSVVAIFAGFQAVSLSIMIAASTTELAKRLSQWGELARVADYLRTAILTVGLFSVVGIGFLTSHALGLRLRGPSGIEPGLLALTFVWAILATLRLSLLMVKLFRYYLERLGD